MPLPRTTPIAPADKSPSTLWEWSQDRHILKHLLVIAVVIGGIIACTTVLGIYANSVTDDWKQYLSSKTPVELVFPDPSSVTPEEQGRLRQLLNTIRDRRELHLNIMTYYYARFFTAIITFSFTAALAAILLVLVGKGGWQQAQWNTGTGYLFTAFFIAVAASVYFNSWPGVFKLEQNISDNKVLLLQYLALENEVLTYAVTNEALNYTLSIEDLQNQSVSSEVMTTTTVISGTEVALPTNPQQQITRVGQSMTPKEFIHYLDLRLAKDNVTIGFDFKQVPNYDNIFKTQ